ncbi:hypothetical protein HN604_02990 [archaeon]|jgi:hypothetical protein|nr:hypothetical protein [archaeon]MBT6182286.1 hypothetical protein [archaeon]MBT6606494.1 hypothetical protein [archaeon]MBT7251341.1 hypothetical protein [archaeon]MBT7661024.1 hypothetical protein [archaeon]
MKISSLVTELGETSTHQDFKRENPKSYFGAGFFIFDLAEKTEKLQLDYFLIEEEEIVSFEFLESDEVSSWQMKKHDEKIAIMKEQVIEVKIDIDDLEEAVHGAFREKNILMKPNKLIAILKENIWNVTVMDAMLGIARVKIDCQSGEVLECGKESLMDFARVKGGDLGKKYDAVKKNI